MLSSLLNSFHQLKLHTDYSPSEKNKQYLTSNHIPVLLKTMLHNMLYIKHPTKDQVVNLIYAKKRTFLKKINVQSTQKIYSNKKTKIE